VTVRGLRLASAIAWKLFHVVPEIVRLDASKSLPGVSLTRASHSLGCDRARARRRQESYSEAKRYKPTTAAAATGYVQP